MAQSLVRSIWDGSQALRVGVKDAARGQQVLTLLIKHGFQDILENRRLSIFKNDKTTAERVCRLLQDLGPTYIKFGQILSTREDILQDHWTTTLSVLQDQVSPLPWVEVKETIENALDAKLSEEFERVDEQPLASASIAQVHRAKLKSGENVVIKVRRRGLRKTLDADLSLMRWLIRRVESIYPEVQIFDLKGALENFRDSLINELDFDREAASLRCVAENFKDDPEVLIPAVYDRVSRKNVLTMGEIHGQKLTSVVSEDARNQLAHQYLDVAFKMLFRDGLFHGDLHPGNVFLDENGRLGLIDFGMVGRLSPSMRMKLVDVMLAVMNEDLAGVARIWLKLGRPTRALDYRAYESDVISILERHVVGKPLSEVRVGAFLNELSNGAMRHGIRVPADFTMLFKALVTTEGLAKQLAGDIDLLEAARPYIETMIASRFTPETLKENALRQAQRWLDSGQDLPLRLDRVLDDLESHGLRIQLQHKASDELAHFVREGFFRLALALVALGLTLAGAILINRGTTFAFGLPLLSLLLWGGAAWTMTLLLRGLKER